MQEQKETEGTAVENPLVVEELPPQEKENKKLFFFGGLGLGIVVFLTATTLFLKLTAPKETPSVLEVNQTTPLPTPGQEINKEAITFEVLNGSGVAGLAKKGAAKLGGLGFTVVKIDNAQSSDYKTSQLFFNEEFKDNLDLVLAALTDFKVTSVSGNLTDSTASARLILGKDFAAF